MLKPIQKALLHIYSDAAGLDVLRYRSVLAANSGFASAADRRFPQTGFDRAMAALEAILFDRVDRLQVPNPIGRNKYIRARTYWRDRAGGPNKITTRQAYRINELWTRLLDHLPPEQQTPAYLASIVVKAAGKRDPGITALSNAEAAALINALQDRLAHAVASTHKFQPARQDRP